MTHTKMMGVNCEYHAEHKTALREKMRIFSDEIGGTCTEH